MAIKRIGIITAGGDCSGLNAVIRAVAKKALNDFGWEVLGIEDGYEGLIEGRARALNLPAVSNILTLGGTILGTSNTASPFAYVKKIGKKFVKEDVSKKVVNQIKKWRLDGLAVIGGDGTLSIAERLGKLGVPIVGIPKTIDNDLSATDLTFGHDTAVQVISDAIDRLHSTAQSHHRVMVVEVMGRYAGWLALRGGLSGGGDIVLIPEIPFRMDKIADVVTKRQGKGKKFSIVVAAEGATEKGKGLVVRQHVEGSPDPIRLGGIGKYVADRIEREIEISSRLVVLGHLQRGGTPTAFDRLLATRFGLAAASLLKEEKFGRMVALKGSEIISVPIKDAVERLKLVPHDHELIVGARSIGTFFGD